MTESAIQESRFARDVFWAALEACIVRLREQTQLVLFDKIPDHDQGLNVSLINRLAYANGLTSIDHPIFSVERITEEGLEHERLLNVYDCSHDAPVTWKTWGRYKLNREVNPHKLTRTIRYLKAWQSKRGAQLAAAERQRARAALAAPAVPVMTVPATPAKSPTNGKPSIIKTADPRSSMAHRASSAARATRSEASWPPNGGWHFRPGEFAYMRTVHPLKRKEWALLKLFAKSKKAMTENQLIKTVWPDDPKVGSDSVQVAIAHLRSQLRKAFRIPKSADPIPTIASGGRKAWKLDIKSLKTLKPR